MKEVILIMLTVFLIACSKDPTPDDTPPIVGENFQGGTVFYVAPDNSFCLIGAESDLPQAPWTDKAFTLIDADNNSLGGGIINTEKIVTAIGPGIYAAKECYDLVLEGYDDWYLPNENELTTMDRALKYELSNTFDDWWTSKEGGLEKSIYALTGPTRMNYQNSKKDIPLRVRPIRKATL